MPTELGHREAAPASLAIARNQFLRLVDLAVPSVLADLRKQVFPQYRRATSHGSHADEAQAALHEAMHSWALRYNLDTEWVRTQALTTLRDWTVRSSAAGWQALPLGAGSPGPSFRWKNRPAVDQRRLAWLVAWQVQRHPLARIARAARVNPRFIRACLLNAARELGLPLRQRAPMLRQARVSGN